MSDPTNPSTIDPNTYRRSLRSDLHASIDRNELVVHYQPKFDLDSGVVSSVEALVRWAHPRYGLLFPNQFIGLAEESGFIAELGEWVLDQACSQAVTWQEIAHSEFAIAVNLSPRQFELQAVDEVVADVLAQTGLAADLLQLELTEHVSLEQSARAEYALQTLHTLGVEWWLDDFGTGYCGLYYLDCFPITGLKIDRRFLEPVRDEGGDAPIVRSVLSLADDLGLGVVAEGVETTSQLDFLRSHGCEQIQGFLSGEPVSSLELEIQLMLDRPGYATGSVA